MLHALGHFCVRYRWLVIILWIAAIVILPVFGMLAWIVAGPRASDARL